MNHDNVPENVKHVLPISWKENDYPVRLLKKIYSLKLIWCGSLKSLQLYLWWKAWIMLLPFLLCPIVAVFCFSEGSLFSGIQAFVCPRNGGSLDPDSWRWYWSTSLRPSWSYYQGNWTLCRNKFLWGYTLPSARTCCCKFHIFIINSVGYTEFLILLHRTLSFSTKIAILWGKSAGLAWTDPLYRAQVPS